MPASGEGAAGTTATSLAARFSSLKGFLIDGGREATGLLTGVSRLAATTSRRLYLMASFSRHAFYFRKRSNREASSLKILTEHSGTRGERVKRKKGRRQKETKK